MRRIVWMAATLILLTGSGLASDPRSEQKLLQTREAVWRAWFAGDTKTLGELVPPETIVITPSDEKWQTQQDVLQSAVEFRTGGGKLIRLEFPRTRVQRFGDAAIVYSQFVLETEVKGKRSVRSGRATETSVFRAGKWVNPGWHTDSR